MQPLQQWICDRCGELIKSPEDGWVEWLQSLEQGAREFHIVHHAPASPYWTGPRSERNCYHHTHHHDRHDMHLDTFLGPNGLAWFLSYIDLGEVLEPEGARPRARIADTRGFVELFRRLHLPYYEEARLYFKDAQDHGDFDGANELTPYFQKTMQRIIQDYGDQDEP